MGYDQKKDVGCLLTNLLSCSVKFCFKPNTVRKINNNHLLG